ncbi:MAG: glycosyltransferase family 2 protein [Actinomycetales bacterium]|nr:glycosyltransferase family 2 protein [Actinomycetales bacterium]
MENRVGIVIPVYNTGDPLAEAADSALQSLGSHRNVVIVDDGSTDKRTKQILIALERGGFRVVRLRHRGVGAARNAGLAVMDVPYACGLDSDDIITPDAPRIAADILDARAEVELVTGSGIEFTHDGVYSDPIPPPNPSRISMRRGSVIANPSMFRLASFRACGGYPEGLSVGEDWVLWMRLLKDGGEVAVSEATFLLRRLHPGQTTRSHIDPRDRAEAWNIVSRENSDLVLAYPDEVIEDLTRLRAQLAAYQHAYRYADLAKRAVKASLGRLRRNPRQY